MKSEIKYAGIGLHQSTCVIALHDEHGKAISESIVKTEAEALRNHFRGPSGTIHVALEVGTQSVWCNRSGTGARNHLGPNRC